MKSYPKTALVLIVILVFLNACFPAQKDSNPFDEAVQNWHRHWSHPTKGEGELDKDLGVCEMISYYVKKERVVDYNFVYRCMRESGWAWTEPNLPPFTFYGLNLPPFLPKQEEALTGRSYDDPL